MKKLLFTLALALACSISAADKSDGWISLFDGKSLAGWKANEVPDTFKVVDGELVVKGPRAHLFYVGEVQGAKFKNFELKLDIKTFPKANSGVYFHTEFQGPGWPAKGYEVQVNNTHGDPKKTAGLYNVKDNFEAPAKDGEWFTMHIKVEGKHVVTSVNGKVIVDYTEEENPPRKANPGRLIGSGTFALQGHDPGSEVHYKNIFVKPLP
ncbi:MAG: DUF1080 domain-containing protein [Verrucomicrobia bacterium]|nr:DUF1080 domain-containing protein [Verrucomicrobiota bacterium]NBU09270.1 DUF1080 domain-containing protein [Pseudomonadota bacterium]NDA65157.1 DUF1080 domain-containing protein [Verrucomicrobiota bacterium]NDD37027.1 DUF1080 domain-containing protein [Verrucomicrobiota bacterium]NDE96813.1 DUF1080 domain-containing protein [Verrucomicrobiota bacterium]